MAQDSILFTTKFFNLYKHQLAPYLICANSSGTPIDSVMLFDDGRHGDSLANDGIYGAILPPRSTEDFFPLSVSTVDQQLNRYTVVPDRGAFTTIPLLVDSLQYTKRNDSTYFLKPFLRNAGTTQSVKNIGVKLTCGDPWVKSVSPDTRPSADISPGQTYGVTAFVVTVDSKSFPGYFYATIEISSDGQPYWKYSIGSPLTGIGTENESRVTRFVLSQNYPNPFNPSTTISYDLPKSANVSLTIYNTLGQLVATLVDERKMAGSYQVSWNASYVPSGIYFYRLQAGEFVETKKLVLIK
jgi:hypothetical protein